LPGIPQVRPHKRNNNVVEEPESRTSLPMVVCLKTTAYMQTTAYMFTEHDKQGMSRFLFSGEAHLRSQSTGIFRHAFNQALPHKLGRLLLLPTPMVCDSGRMNLEEGVPTRLQLFEASTMTEMFETQAITCNDCMGVNRHAFCLRDRTPTPTTTQGVKLHVAQASRQS
jgi:hypothetical protein